jgi:NAD-dependent deacetylase
VNIYTQNVDDLHERAGSKNVFHLHGNITQARSVCDEDRIIDIGYKNIMLGDKHEDGGQLRPHIVFFDEFIYFEEEAAQAVKESDIVIAIGTSLCVYPAAHLPLGRKAGVPFYIVDPSELPRYMPDYYKNPIHIKQPASVGMKELYDTLIEIK